MVVDPRQLQTHARRLQPGVEGQKRIQTGAVQIKAFLKADNQCPKSRFGQKGLADRLEDRIGISKE